MTLPISVRYHSNGKLDPAHPNAFDVQRHLKARGYSVGPAGVDGVIGVDSDRAIRRYQTHVGVEVDGVVGPVTWRHLSASVPTPGAGATGQRLASLMKARVTGTDGAPRMRYDFGFEIARLAAQFPAFGDCSEAVQWAVYQLTGDSWVDGSASQFHACRRVSVRDASHTPGALLFIASDPSDLWSIHHVAVSLGDGLHTAEARSSHLYPNCGVWPNRDYDDWRDSRTIEQRFSAAGTIPLIHY